MRMTTYTTVLLHYIVRAMTRLMPHGARERRAHRFMLSVQVVAPRLVRRHREAVKVHFGALRRKCKHSQCPRGQYRFLLTVTFSCRIIRNGIVVVVKNATIPDNTVI